MDKIKLNKKYVLVLFLVFFGFLGNATNYYVNNTYSATDDIFCSASGLDANGRGKSPSTPAQTLSWLIKTSGYTFTNGDVIYVDAGTYFQTDQAINITIGGLKIQGAGIAKTIFSYNSGTGGSMNKRLFSINADNIVLSDFYIKGYGYMASDYAKAIDIKAGVKGIKINNIVSNENTGQSGLHPIVVHSGAEVEFNGGGSTCNNQNQPSAGGVKVEGASTIVRFNNYSFSGNYNEIDGSALRVENGTVDIYNSLVENNVVANSMKGVFYISNGTLSIYDTKFSNNSYLFSDADALKGSVLFIEGGNVKIKRSIIQNSDNGGTASQPFGGGITLNNAGAVLNIDSTFFQNNQAKFARDILVINGTVNAYECRFNSSSKQVGKSASATFNISHCGSPSVSTGGSGAALVNFSFVDNIAPNYTPNPTTPNTEGNCSSGLKICEPAITGGDVSITCPISTATLSVSGNKFKEVFYWYTNQTRASKHFDSISNVTWAAKKFWFDTSSTSTPSITTPTITATTTFYVVSASDACSTPIPITVTYDCPSCNTTISYPSAIVCSSNDILTVTKLNSSNASATFSVSPVNAGSTAALNTNTGAFDLSKITVPGKYTITMAEGATCNPNFDITINPNGDATTSVTGLSPICAGENAVFTITGTKNEVITYSGVTGSPASPVTLDALGKATVTVANATKDTTITLGTATSGSCPTTLSNKTFKITVNPVGDANTSVVGNGPICTGQDAVFTISGKKDEVISYSGVTGLPANPVTLDASGQATVTVTAPNSDQTITLNSVTNGSCSTPLTKSVTVTVNTKPAKPLFNNVIQPNCSAPNGSADVTNYIPSPATYIFNPSSGISITTPGKISASSGKYKFVVTQNGCTSDSSDLLTMDVVPDKPEIDGPTQVCVDQTITLKAWKYNSKSDHATPNASSPWVIDNGNVTLTAGSDINIKGVTGGGTTKITFTDDKNCIAEYTITVNALPTVPSLSYVAANPVVFTGNLDDTVCKGNNVDYRLYGTAGNTAYFKGKTTPLAITVDPSGVNNLSISQLIKDTVVVLDSISNGLCSVSLSSQLKFVVSDTAFTVTPNQTTACLTSTGSIDVITSSGGKITWTNSDGSVSGTHDVNSATNYQIPNLKSGSYTVNFFNGGCELTKTVTITDPGAPKKPYKITSSGPTTFCEGGSITLEASPIPNGATVIVNWTKNGSAFGTGSSISVSSSGTYAVSVTDAGCTSGTNDTVVTVNPLPNAPTTTTTTQEFCKSEDAKISNLSPTGTSIKWYDLASGGTQYTDPTTALTATTYYASQTDNNGCESTNRLAVTVKIYANPVPKWSAQPGGSTCLGTDVTYNTLSGMVNYVWTVPGTQGVDYTITSGGIGATNHIVIVKWLTAGPKKVSVGFTQDNLPKTCSTLFDTSARTIVVNNPTPQFSTSAGNTSCTEYNVTYTTDASKSNYVWNVSGVLNTDYQIVSGSVAGNSSTVTLKWLTSTPNSKTVTVHYTDPATSCTSTIPATSTTIVNPTPSAPTSTAAIEFCSDDNANLDMVALKLTGSTIKWYNVSDVQYNNPALVIVQDQQTYYATQTVGGCESKAKLPVTVTIHTNPGAPSGLTTQAFCKGKDDKVLNLNPQSTATYTIEWYDNTNTLKLGSADLKTGTYTALASQNGCYSTAGLVVNVTVDDPQTPNASTATLCANNSPAPMLYDLYPNNNSILYYSSGTSTTPLANQLINNNDQYFVRTVSPNASCLSSALSVIVQLSTGPQLAASYTIPKVCENKKPDLDYIESLPNSTLPTNQGTIYWLMGQNNSLSNALPKNTPIQSGTYWIAVKDAKGCLSKTRQANITVDAGKKADLKSIDLCGNLTYKISDLNVADLTVPSGIITWYFAKDGTHAANANETVLKNQEYWATYKQANDPNACESNEMVKLTLNWVEFPTTLTVDNHKQEFCKTTNHTVSELSLLPYSSTQNIGWFDDLNSKTPLAANASLYELTYYAGEYTITSDGKYCASDKKDAVEVKFYTPKMYPTITESVCTKKTGVMEFVNAPTDYVFNWYELSNITQLDYTGTKYNKPLEKQSFKIVILDSKGCKDSIQVSMPTCSDSPIPQILTPGKDDGKNDKWVISYSEKYKNVQVKIFNRWGEEVYVSSIPYKDDWDGKYKNDYLPTGTYYYIIDKGNGEPVETGYIELVK